ncbi:MAG: hypothetical protein PVF73_13495, partial [Bacteroidales bacterium]
RDSEDVILSVKGNFSLHSYLRPSPLKHFILRFVSFLAGNKIIGWLKYVLIFSQKKCSLKFSRNIFIKDDRVIIEDDISHIGTNTTVYRAPYYSLRHVSSAGRFSDEELMATNVRLEQISDHKITRIIECK